MRRLKLTGPVMAVALLVSWPALQHGLVDHTLSVQTMLIRLGVALALGMVGQVFLVSVIESYRLQNIMRKNRQEAGMQPAGDEDAARGS